MNGAGCNLQPAFCLEIVQILISGRNDCPSDIKFMPASSKRAMPVW
jgi:hypothetical protein